MQHAAELAGFFTAHGIWSVSDGGPLTPILAQESAAHGRNMLRFAADDLEEGVEQARQYLDANLDSSACAALVYDGFITLPSGRTDALLVEIRSYADPVATLTMAVPYRRTEATGGFAVHRPKFLEWQGPGTPDYAALGEAFLRGVDSHKEASVVWAEHRDDSV
jgi:hypothetical protein